MGRHLATALAREHRVIRLNRRATGAPDEVIHDLAQPLPSDRLPRQIDMVVHAAGLIGRDANSSPLCQRINVDATAELADYAVRARAKGFVFLSTGGVYAHSSGRLTEQSAVSPLDGYTRSKLAAEQAAQERSDAFDVKVLRLFFPYGPTQTGRLIPSLIERVARGIAISLQNSAGQPLVTPIYIDDLTEYLRRVIGAPGSFVANVAGNDVVSIRTLGEMIGAALKRDVSFTVEDTGQAYNWWGGNTLISTLTEYSPRTSVKCGLSLIVEAATSGVA